MVFIKKVSNVDVGDADHLGGDDWDALDNYHDDVDITPKVAKINTRTYFRSGKFELRNPANTFSNILISSSIAANRNLTIPLLTANSNIIVDALGSAGGQVFLEPQQIRTNTDEVLLQLYRQNNAIGSHSYLQFFHNNSASASFPGGHLGFEIGVNTAGAESTDFYLFLRNAGTTNSPFAITRDGTLFCGGPNRRVKFNEGGLTAQRTFTFPDSDTKLVGQDASVSTLAEGKNFVLGTTTGTMIGTGATQKLGFFGKAPVTQRPADPNTTGATLAALETEVNALKQILRDYGLLA